MLRSPQGSAPRALPRATHPPAARELSELGDHALLELMWEGNELALGELFNRHAEAVRRYARRTYGTALDADDLVAEAFFRVLQTVRRGTGRIEHPRAYLLTVARRIAMEWATRRRDVPVDDDELAGRIEATLDRSPGSVERHLIARAFANLPERWRSVLWRVEVEGERPSVVGGYLGLSANATAALARRARDGLRAAYLQAHLADRPGPVSCRSVVAKLGAYTCGSVRGAERRRIGRHLEVCGSCAALHAELADVCSGLRAHAGYVGPVVGLGTALHQAPGGSLGLAGKLGFGGKLAALAGRTKVAMAATAAAGVGVLGVVTSGVLHDANPQALSGYDGGRGDRVTPVCTSCVTGTSGPAVSTRPTTTTSHNPASHNPAPRTLSDGVQGAAPTSATADEARGRVARHAPQSRSVRAPRATHLRDAPKPPNPPASTAGDGKRMQSDQLPGWDSPMMTPASTGGAPSSGQGPSESPGPSESQGPGSEPASTSRTAPQRSAEPPQQTYRMRSADSGSQRQPALRIHIRLPLGLP